MAPVLAIVWMVAGVVLNKTEKITKPRTNHWEGMNRKQRRELTRKIQSQDLSLEVVHTDAASIDIGNESHYVAVPSTRDSQPVRRFGCTTGELQAMAEWLKQCRILSVAMQSTGVYWVRPTTAFGYRAPLGDTRHPSPASGGENSRGAGADNPADCKLVVGDGAEMPKTSFGSKDNGGSRSCGFLRVRTEDPRGESKRRQGSKRNQKGYAITDGNQRVLAAVPMLQKMWS